MDNLHDPNKLMGTLEKSIVFTGLGKKQIKEIADRAKFLAFKKGDYIFQQGEKCQFFFIVAQGLIKASFSSLEGNQITYLLAEAGEPLNLIFPFSSKPRPATAKALKEALVIGIKKDDFLSFVYENPLVISNIITILGQALDSANTRIIDMMEKKVDQRLFKVLYTLYKKFGSTLKFTSTEIADLVGTTTESTLRSMARLRSLGIIESQRGQIIVTAPDRLEQEGREIIWI